jgi:Endosomal/lysosomal potassium channel TMEM175
MPRVWAATLPSACCGGTHDILANVVSQTGLAWSSYMEKDTGWVEAFSDGVFAIALTLLILEIYVPQASADAANGDLFAAITCLCLSFLGLDPIFLSS